MTTSITRAISISGTSFETTRGVNAQSVVSEEAITGVNMRVAPVVAASAGLAPASNCVTASSPTTMASSTTMPSAMMKPIRLIALMVPPSR